MTKRKLLVPLMALLLAVAVVAATLLGACNYSLSRAFTDADASEVLLQLRLPRVLFGALLGGALAVVGAAYQALFRNALASPFSLGVSSGAALGASVAIFFGAWWPLGVDATAIAAAGLSIVVILSLNRSRAAASQESLLLIGVVFSLFCSSLLTLLQYLSDYSQIFRASRWMLGAVPSASWPTVGVAALLAGCTTAWLWRNHRKLDLILFGEEFAALKGADPYRLSRATFLVTSVTVGWFVAQCGVIGFVGIIVPAAIRLLVGIHHRRVLPLSFLMGALLVVSCDLLGRLVTPPFEVPAGVFTAVIGGPIFVALLVRSGREML